jgi:(1->4)-alpha-D-glucan 1-alpha-D-glucosylmutase
MSPTAIPTSTYRVQFNAHFRFTDGEALVPYLDELGVGWLYASPYFRARPGSEHGYDVVDHNHLNPEIGDEREHRAMIDALHARGMGHLLDFVPNHMGIGPENPWWRSVLELGPASPYAKFFDIDWHAHASGRGKVVLPVLGDHYGSVIERGELRLIYNRDSHALELHYFDHVFPLAPATYAHILEHAGAQSDLDIDAAVAEYAADPDRLDALMRAQHYRLVYWRAASDEINYRRFFDINDLAGLRIEDAEVLARTHELVFAMIADGRVQGLRIDHVDGLANPAGYVNLLVDRALALGQALYLVVEKIVLGTETLRPDWHIDGTTGYEFMNLVLGLFVDPAAERSFDRIYARAIERSTSFADEAYEAKRRVMRVDLASELTVLSDALARIAATDRRSNDFTTLGIRRALIEVIAAFPVYRTYVVDDEIGDEDLAIITGSVHRAASRAELPDAALFGFVADALAGRLALEAGTRYDRIDVLRFAMRFQQYTGPVTAKSLEDTAFYRYVRLAALNEVGGEPAIFGRSVAAFHAANLARARTHPHALLATATHDHKRGEDTRLRIAALSEFPTEWSRAIGRWSRMNAGLHDARIDAPSRIDAYLFYQTVIGTLEPAMLAEEPTAEAHAAYVERIVAYMVKAVREAKRRTSWTDPNPEYEAALDAFVRGALGIDAPFFRDARALAAQLAPVSAVHGLAQLALKLTVPGVPDIYQGCELWDFSLVDPDNRRAVDYDARRALLAQMRAHDDLAALCDDALANWHDGRIKLLLTWRLLQLRRERAATFAGSSYRALRSEGGTEDRVVAFERDDIVVIAPRLVRGRLDAGSLRLVDDAARVMIDAPQRRYRSAIDGREVTTDADGGILLAIVLGALPLAVLVPIT